MNPVSSSANGHANRRPEEFDPEGEVEAREAPQSRLPKPTPVVQPPRKLDLALAATPLVGEVRRVEQLSVRELKGVGQLFTADVARGLKLQGLAYKPQGSFSTHYQILTGRVLDDPRVARRAVPIAFIPAFAWSTREVVLLPIKVHPSGQDIIAGLQTLQARFPKYKVYSEWDGDKHRHVLQEPELQADEAERIELVEWPDEAAVMKVLEGIAFDSIDDLCRVNGDIRTALTAKEVK